MHGPALPGGHSREGSNHLFQMVAKEDILVFCGSSFYYFLAIDNIAWQQDYIRNVIEYNCFHGGLNLTIP